MGALNAVSYEQIEALIEFRVEEGGSNVGHQYLDVVRGDDYVHITESIWVLNC